MSLEKGVKVKIFCSLCENRVQDEMPYYADNVVLSAVQCPEFFRLCQGAEEKAMQTSLAVFFWGGLCFYINQINTVRGLYMR